MTGVVCEKCWKATTSATKPVCADSECPGKPKPFLTGVPIIRSMETDYAAQRDERKQA